MPPAATMTSPPSASASGQDRPKGPRTPSTSPARAAQIAVVARPTARTVWTSVAGAAGSPLIEMGTSPAPPAESMVNWPGAKGSPSPPLGTSARVTVSSVSSRRAVTAKAAGTIAAAPTSTSGGLAIDVEELEAGGLEALGRSGGEAAHELIAELVVGLALAAQA